MIRSTASADDHIVDATVRGLMRAQNAIVRPEPPMSSDALLDTST